MDFQEASEKLIIHNHESNAEGIQNRQQRKQCTERAESQNNDPDCEQNAK